MKELICKNCTNTFSVPNSKNRTFCSGKCAQTYTKSKDRSWLNKRDITNVSKYGVKSPLESSVVRQKYKDNLTTKYGVDNPFLVPEFLSRAKQSILSKYNVSVASQNKDVANKISISMKGKPKDRTKFVDVKWEKILSYCSASNLEPLFDKQYLEDNKVNHVYGNSFGFRCIKCKTSTDVQLCNGYLPSCSKCSNHKGYSLVEDNITSFIINNDSDVDVKLKDRTILPNKFELDILITNKNLAIEVNGIYWHSEVMGKYKDYHVYKTNECLKQNIQLLHIFDWEYLNKKEIVESMILNKLGKTPNKIYARKCVVKSINDNKVIKDFLNNNHIQGYCASSTKLGLYHNDELVSIMTFGVNRFKKHSSEIELIRFCNKLNTNVVGGASKLFSYFVKNNTTSGDVIISFADRRYSNGGLYPSLGFTFTEYTSPSYIYWKGNTILKRMVCQKHKLHKILPIFDSKISEYKNMLANGYNRVWDCGNYKFTYIVK